MKAAGGAVAALQPRIDQLNAAVTNYADGDVLAFSWVPGDALSVDVNAASRARIEGADFARALLGIWLGPEPPNADLKTGLLGGGCD